MDNTGFVFRQTQELFYPTGSLDPIWSQKEEQGALISAGVNRPERAADYSPPSIQVKSECIYTSIPHIRLHGVCGEHLSIQLLRILYKCLYIH